LIGRTISHYRILEQLGAGGMGVVYEARDTKLDRTVALKFLTPELTREPEAKTRFIQEAKAAAALAHPNICTIFEIDEAEQRLFIAMECIAGQSLKEKIATGPLKLHKAISIAMQIAEGLQEAHEKGIVHRDIKPANVMLTAKEQAKIMDFGLARSVKRTQLTRDGTTLGTAAYMSPEQARSQEVDHRTDIWSLGIVLYEMIVGRVPFVGDNEQAMVYSILNDEQEPLTALRTGVPLELERIVGKCLTKNPAERYQTVADLLADFRRLQREVSDPADRSRVTVAPRTTSRSSRRWLGLAALVLIAIAAVVVGTRLLRQPRDEIADDRKMLVVLPFENLGPSEEEYFADGITDAITARLASIKELGVISRQSAIQYKGTSKSIRQIGDELGVDYILEGTIQREKPGDPASRVRVIPQLVRVADDTHVWAMTYDEDMSEVFRVQSDIAERVATQLDITLMGPKGKAVERRPTENLDAYDHYLRGMNLYRRFNLADAEVAVQLLQRAVALDPEFVEARAWLAMVYHHLYWVWDRPGVLLLETEAANHAYELAPNLQETRLALGWVDYANREFDKALSHFKAAQSLRPNGDALQAIGFTLRRLGRWQEALDQFEDARRLTPREYMIHADGFGNTLSMMRRFEEAERHLDRAISLVPDVADAYLDKAYVLVAKNGDVGAAKRVLLEMTRRVIITQVAMIVQGLIRTSLIRLFPETYTEAFDAFESGSIERYRQTHPALIASVHLGRALVYETMENHRAANARYDSARVHFERITHSNPQSAYNALYLGDLGLAYAGLGRTGEAIRLGKEAVRGFPVSKDAFVGHEPVRYLAEIYMMCGEHAAAIDQLETLLSVPSRVSVGLLRVDPIWDPLRDHPRFQQLLEKGGS
jgi:non-specific serine/threonine protein kinase